MYKLNTRTVTWVYCWWFPLMIIANVGLLESAMLSYKLLQARSDRVKSIIIEGLSEILEY